MAGTLSSLGLGSSGALSADTIDKLKTNDEQLQINPITAKIENTTQKTQAYDLISSLATGLSASTDRLGGDLLYLNRSTSVTGEGATVTAQNGVAPQSFTVDVTTLATKNINQSTAFGNISAPIATADDTVSIDIDGQTFNIDVTATTTLEEFKNSINDIAGEKVIASILNVADGDFRLIVSSKETGSDQGITFSDNGFLTGSLVDQADVDADGIADGLIQTAGDSSFKYNGINFTRSSNTITDITVGVSITLLEEAKSATATVTQNTDDIVTELTTLTSASNSLFKELTNTTTSDLDEGTVGVFNGESTIKTLSREINKLLFQIDPQGNSIVNYGFELNQNGTLTFDAAAFKTEFDKDPDAAEKLFKYETDGNGDVTDGIFKKLDDYLDNQTSSNGLLSTFGTSLSNQVDALFEEQTRAQTLLDARYETMFFRFAAYDRIIGGLEQQFSSLQQQIEMAINAN